MKNIYRVGIVAGIGILIVVGVLHYIDVYMTESSDGVIMIDGVPFYPASEPTEGLDMGLDIIILDEG